MRKKTLIPHHDINDLLIGRTVKISRFGLTDGEKRDPSTQLDMVAVLSGFSEGASGWEFYFENAPTMVILKHLIEFDLYIYTR